MTAMNPKPSKLTMEVDNGDELEINEVVDGG
jgi:hypothetical protein